MADASLLIKVGADTKDAQAGISDVQKKLAALYAQLDAAKGRQANLIDPGNIRDAGTEISKITKQIDSLNGNQGFENLGKDAGKALGPLNDVFSSVRKIAYILPGIGIAGIFGLALDPIIDFVKEIKAASTKVDELAAKLSIFNDVNKEADKEASKDLTNLKILYSVTQDVTQSIKDRTDAAKKLQEIYPDVFKNVSAETILNGGAKKSYDDLAISILNAAKAEAAKNKITELQAQLLDNAFKKQKILNANAQENAIAKPQSFGGAGGAAASLDVNAVRAANNARAQEAIKQIEQQDKILKSQQDFLVKFAGGNTALANTIDKPKEKPPTTTQKVQDENLQYLEKIKTLTESIGKKDDSTLFKKFAESAEGALGNLNFSIYQEQLKKATADAAKGAITPETFVSYAAALKAAFQHTSNPNLKIPISFQLADEEGAETSEEISKSISDIGRHMKPLPLHLVINGIDQDSFAKTLEEAKKFSKQLNGIVNNGLADALGGAFEGIGSAIGEGKNVFETAGKALLEGIGSLIEQLGKALLEYGIVKTAIDIFGENIAIPGGVAIAAGAAAIAAGALVKTAASAHAFADGGIVTGPVMGLVGEAGPEAIIPLNKLDKVIQQTQGAGTMTVDFRGRLQGNDIRLSQLRTARTQGMV